MNNGIKKYRFRLKTDTLRGRLSAEGIVCAQGIVCAFRKTKFYAGRLYALESPA